MTKPRRFIVDLADDGEIDEQAVRLAVFGIRLPDLTSSERREVISRIILMDSSIGPAEVRRRSGASIDLIRKVARDIGYETIPDPLAHGKPHRIFVRIDRPKGSARSAKRARRGDERIGRTTGEDRGGTEVEDIQIG